MWIVVRAPSCGWCLLDNIQLALYGVAAASGCVIGCWADCFACWAFFALVSGFLLGAPSPRGEPSAPRLMHMEMETKNGMKMGAPAELLHFHCFFFDSCASCLAHMQFVETKCCVKARAFI